MGNRLAEARGRITQEEFAELLGVHANTQGRYERGERIPDNDYLNALAVKADVHPMWLLHGAEPRSYRQATGGEPDASWKQRGAYPTGGVPSAVIASEPMADSVYVKLFEVEQGAARPWEGRVVAVRGFSRSWLWEKFRATESDVYLREVRGDSMRGVINDGDTILVDKRDRTVSVDDVYDIRIDQALHPRNLQRLPGGLVKVWSQDDALSPPFTVNLQDEATLQHFEILGRVLWRGGTLRR